MPVGVAVHQSPTSSISGWLNCGEGSPNGRRMQLEKKGDNIPDRAKHGKGGLNTTPVDLLLHASPCNPLSPWSHSCKHKVSGQDPISIHTVVQTAAPTTTAATAPPGPRAKPDAHSWD